MIAQHQPDSGGCAHPDRQLARSLMRACVRCIGGWMLSISSCFAASEQPLFESAEPLPVTLTISMSDLRDSGRSDEPFAGTLSYRDDAGAAREFDLEITLRGHSRRELCDMPPLKLNFKRSQVAGSVFANQNKLKLVTHCRSGRQFERYLQQEYALYGGYAALTDNAFRVRLLDLSYVDRDGRKRDLKRAAFLIEDDGLLAERVGFEELATPVAATASLAPDAITLFGLFQFMIGNTDWSLLKGRGDADCCHNGLLLRRPDDLLVIIPYDFDQAGLIDAHYALPAEGLGINSVRQRVFRGLCTGDAQLAAAIAHFNARREAIKAHFPLVGPHKRANRRSRRYIGDFFEIINDVEQRQRLIEDACRGDESFWDWMKTRDAAAQLSSPGQGLPRSGLALR